MARIYRNRLFVVGLTVFMVGMIHLWVFYSEATKGDHSSVKDAIVYKKVAIPSFRVPDIDGLLHTKDKVNTKGKDVFKLRVLEEQKRGTTKSSREVLCDGESCENFNNKFKNKPGYLNIDTLSELVTQPPNNEYRFPPSELKISVISDKRLPNDSYFHLSDKILNTVPKRIAIHNPYLCSLPQGKPPYLLVLVPSVVSHVFERKTIRQTWGSVAYNGGKWTNFTLEHSVRILFILGSQQFSDLDNAVIKQEAEEYGDLLLSDFVDSYRNLSLKVAVGLAWSRQYCQGVNHVVKVDEDTFVFLPKLLVLLRQTDLQYRKFVMGFPHLNPSPFVLRRGKWRVDPSLYPYESYPRYVYGHSYVISGHAVKTILSAYFRMPFITNEDAFFTGILPVVTETTRLGHRSFALSIRHEQECDVAKGKFVSVTSCCNTHHQTIFNAIKYSLCNTRKLNELYEPKCKFNKKPPNTNNGNA